jgi:hypothetical protein
MRLDRVPCAALLAAAVVLSGADAFAFCRQRASNAPPGPSGCVEEGLPVYWPSSCVGYHMNQAASSQVSLADASAIMAGAFAGWLGGSDVCFPSISVTALAPTASTTIGYDMNGPNENIVVFRDEGLGATFGTVLEAPTTTYDIRTGEILDVDIEINTHDHTFIFEDTVDAGDSYDLRYVLTHSAGHFFGLAHSQVEGAVMQALASPGVKPRPWIQDDDARGICAIYPQNGTRTTTDASGNGITVPATTCNLVAETTAPCANALTVSHGCSFSRTAKPPSFGLAALAMAACAAVRRRRSSSKRVLSRDGSRKW